MTKSQPWQNCRMSRYSIWELCRTSFPQQMCNLMLCETSIICNFIDTCGKKASDPLCSGTAHFQSIFIGNLIYFTTVACILLLTCMLQTVWLGMLARKPVETLWFKEKSRRKKTYRIHIANRIQPFWMHVYDSMLNKLFLIIIQLNFVFEMVSVLCFFSHKKRRNCVTFRSQITFHMQWELYDVQFNQERWKENKKSTYQSEIFRDLQLTRDATNSTNTHCDEIYFIIFWQCQGKWIELDISSCYCCYCSYIIRTHHTIQFNQIHSTSIWIATDR